MYIIYVSVKTTFRLYNIIMYAKLNDFNSSIRSIQLGDFDIEIGLEYS